MTADAVGRVAARAIMEIELRVAAEEECLSTQLQMKKTHLQTEIDENVNQLHQMIGLHRRQKEIRRKVELLTLTLLQVIE